MIKRKEIFQLIYNNKEYGAFEFSNYCKKQKLFANEEIKKAIIIYSDKHMSYDEYQKDLIATSKKFKPDKENVDYMLLPDFVYMYDPNLYNCVRFLSSLCETITAGYHYAIESYGKIPIELYGIKNYYGCFYRRALDFSTSVLWYNNAYSCFLQIFCTKFNFYSKLTKNDVLTLDFDEIASLCKIKNIKNVISKMPRNKENKELFKWWDIIDKFSEKMEWINNVANSLKHKSGVSYKNLNSNNVIEIVKNNKKMSDSYKTIKIDIDKDFEKLIEAHNEIKNVYSFMIKKINKEIEIKKSEWDKRMK